MKIWLETPCLNNSYDDLAVPWNCEFFDGPVTCNLLLSIFVLRVLLMIKEVKRESRYQVIFTFRFIYPL